MIKFPFTSLQQLNLDWIMQQLHKILDFMPLNGVAGDVLQRTVDGAAWQPIAAISMDIHSLNSTTPDPADEIPIYDNDLVGNYKTTVQDVLDLAPVQSVNGQTGDVVLTIPTVPVTSVNGQTGDVVLSIPTQTSDLVNDSGFVDAAGAAAAAPVQSVNGSIGAVTLPVINNIGLTEFKPTVTPNGNSVTIHNNQLMVEITPDKKRIRISGFLTFKSDSSMDWKWLDLTDANDDPIDFVHPAANTTLNNAGILFDQDKLPAFMANCLRLRYDTNGAVHIMVYQGTSTPNLDQTVFFFGNWVQLSL